MTPERSLAQRRDALGRANEIRMTRAALKRDLKAGKVSIHDLLLEPPEYVHSAKVFDLLLAAPAYGRVKINKVLMLCRISPSKTVGGLSARQRTELVSMLQRRPRGPMRTTGNHSGTEPNAQHMLALTAANTVRLDRADIKRQVADGEKTVGDVLRERPAAARSMTIAQLLMAQHRWGRTRARRFLASVPLMETKTLGTMSSRQRMEVIRRLDRNLEQGFTVVPTPPTVPAEPATQPEPSVVLSGPVDMETYRSATSACLHKALPGSLYTLCGMEPDHQGLRLVSDREWDQRQDARCRRCISASHAAEAA